MNIAFIIASILEGLESFAASMVMAVLAIFIPQLLLIEQRDFDIIAANFKKFLKALESGTPWGEALADMLTADWNTVADDAKQVAIDFAEAVGTAFEKVKLSK